MTIHMAGILETGGKNDIQKQTKIHKAFDQVTVGYLNRPVEFEIPSHKEYT